MVKPNNPYAHTVHATKDTAMTIGEFYGKRVTDKTLSNAAGGRNVTAAARYQAAGNAYVPPKTKKTKPVSTVETAVTAEDLFG